MLAVGLLALAVTFSWLRHHVSRGGRFYRQLAGLARRHPLLRNVWLRQSGNGEVPLASLLLLILSLGGLSGWTLLVMQHGAEGPLLLDRQVHTLFAAWPFPWLEAVGQALARAGDLLGVLALSLPWAAWLLWR
ncbi:hypothetical protein, partial [Staphylococcus aureus]|uniref:hypothetical protein n=1 Tax=Staphylococcus aureus TaxID=1280 RepID=UPI00301CBCB7